ncbi:MAG TPA: chromosome segregation protein SMC [candidate division Zixibacteria bacterium]|nr:chromosome segregation protein SMC [candidate division Zixibacteria bacterium]
MRLKRLEMTGFKSFAERTALDLTRGITAVVGPNGCGKSNIVDALRWAMGEQSAKHLRGHLMEDVIFNGSDSLAATGMAEVSLVFDNEDGRGPVEYNGFSEIMVTRRLFRSGESEYSINKVPCRLKDIIELFLGTGVGSKAYSIVEQGRIDELVNAKPEERRALIEEAAGTSKYKSRKLIAERKLEKTQQNLLRVSDIVREIERQIRSMELQAKKAERYRALRAELREKELLWAALRRRGAAAQIALDESRLADTEARLAECQAALRAKEAESEAVRLEMMELEKKIGAQQEEVYQARIDIQTQEQRIDFYRKDLEQIEGTEAEARASLRALEEKLEVLAREIAELEKAKESVVQLSLFEESFLRRKEAELAEAQARMEALQRELERDKETLIELANRAAHLRNEAAAKERRREEIERDLQRSRAEHGAALEAAAACERKLAETGSALESCLAQASERSLESAQVNASIQSLARSREEQEQKIAALKEQLHESRSRLLSLEELQKNYEGYHEGVRAIMLKKRRQEPASDGIYGLVAEVLEAPEAYEKALTAVLGDRLQYVIVRGQEEGVEAIEYLKREASGRGSFIPLQLARRSSKPLPLGEAEVVGPLLEKISVKEGYREVAEYLLADVVLVKDLKAGLALWSRNGYYSTLVTPDGEVIDSMGVVTGGSGDSLEGSLLAQRRRMRELRELIADLQARLERELGELADVKERLEESETRKATLASEIHRLELERVRLETERRATEQEADRLRRAIDTLVQEQRDLATALELLADQIAQCGAETEACRREAAAREAALGEKQASFAALKGGLESAEAEVTQSRIRNAALGEKREHSDQTLKTRLALKQETAAQIAARRAQIDGVLRKREETAAALATAETALASAHQRLAELDARLQLDRDRYRETSRRVAAIEESIRELRPLGEACQEERNRLHVALAEKRVALQHLADSIREKYDVDLAAVPLADDASLPAEETLAAEIEDWRGRLERMGEVNLAAIGEYEELSARFQFMSQQKEDLEKSMADLQRTIVKLNRICRLRFRESFEAINEKFQAVFPRLFHGGKARLVLTDENDFLETGVDIVVQPPGKKLQSITLLSGGEKALTAVSLLFAIFLTKPSPFCFLDEVDAPLDDANIDRFIDLVKEMSSVSQFILITHNKKTMQAAEVLYGVTMAEPGVSKIVSVRMS